MEVQRQVRQNFPLARYLQLGEQLGMQLPLYSITSHLDSTANASDQGLDLQGVHVLQQDADEDLNDRIGNDHNDGHIYGDFDFLTDIDQDKDIYRLKVFIFSQLNNPSI